MEINCAPCAIASTSIESRQLHVSRKGAPSTRETVDDNQRKPDSRSAPGAGALGGAALFPTVPGRLGPEEAGAPGDRSTVPADRPKGLVRDRRHCRLAPKQKENRAKAFGRAGKRQRSRRHVRGAGTGSRSTRTANQDGAAKAKARTAAVRSAEWGGLIAALKRLRYPRLRQLRRLRAPEAPVGASRCGPPPPEAPAGSYGSSAPGS